MKKLFAILLTVILLVNITTIIVADDEIEGRTLIDTTKPELILEKDKLRVRVGDDVDFKKYVEASDDSGNVRVMYMSDSDITKVGTHNLTIIATDYSGNCSKETMVLETFSEEDWNAMIESITWKPNSSYTLNANLEELMGEVDEDVLALARKFIGMPGSCDKVAQAFINAFFGEGHHVTNWSELEEVDMLDAKPGDIIYYANGGLGQQHYATYLGGSTALQGNIHNTTKIGNVFMYMGSTPRFFRFKSLMD